MSGLDQLRAGVERNKKGLAVAGAAVVGGLALMQARKGDKGAAAGDNTPASASLSAGSSPVYAAAGGYAPGYDSTAPDLYNAIQPQIEYLQQLAEKQANQTTPVPTAPKVNTNTDWLRAATEGWAKAGHNPLDIQAALGQYLQGRPVSQAQTAGIAWAIKTYGAAPTGTKGVSKVVSAPAKKPAAKPPAKK